MEIGGGTEIFQTKEIMWKIESLAHRKAQQMVNMNENRGGEWVWVLKEHSHWLPGFTTKSPSCFLWETWHQASRMGSVSSVCFPIVLHVSTAAHIIFDHNCQLMSLFPTSHVSWTKGYLCLTYLSSLHLTLSYKILRKYLLNGWMNTFTHQEKNLIMLVFCLERVLLWDLRQQSLRPKIIFCNIIRRYNYRKTWVSEKKTEVVEERRANMKTKAAYHWYQEQLSA